MDFQERTKTRWIHYKYKARLVSKGYRQNKLLHFFDTYSPVTRITSIMLLIAIAALHNLEIHQMDIKTFLIGELEEEIYMEQPKGFVSPNHKQKVCKLVKFLYELKQSPKQWHWKLDKTILSNEFKINECDKCVHVKQTLKVYVIVCLYVDNMLIMANSHEIMINTKKMLTKHFEMKDLGVTDVTLGIKITIEKIIFFQSHYIESILKMYNVCEESVAEISIDTSLHLVKNMGECVSQLKYSQVIDNLMFITNCTRSDTVFSVNKLSTPSHNYWKALTRVLR